MFKRLSRRPYHTAIWGTASALSLIACTPPQNVATPVSLPAACHGLADQYTQMHAATTLASDSQRALQQGVRDAITFAGYRTTALRENILLVATPRTVETLGMPNVELTPIALGTSTAHGVTYPVFLGLRLGNAASGTRADGKPSYGLIAVSDMPEIVQPTAAGVTRFTPAEESLTAAHLALLPPDLRGFDQSLLPDSWISLAELHAQQAPIITGQGRIVARTMDAIETAQREDPRATERCERFIFNSGN